MIKHRKESFFASKRKTGNGIWFIFLIPFLAYDSALDVTRTQIFVGILNRKNGGLKRTRFTFTLYFRSNTSIYSSFYE